MNERSRNGESGHGVRLVCEVPASAHQETFSDDSSYCSTISLTRTGRSGTTAAGGDEQHQQSSSTLFSLQYPQNSSSPPLIPSSSVASPNPDTLLVQFTSHDIIQVGHYINTVGAFSLAIYFTYYNSYRSLQYYQISFVSILLLLLEKRHSPALNVLFLSFGLLIGALWNIVITILFYRDLSSTSSMMKTLSILSTSSSFTLILSWLYYAYYSKPFSGDVDLMIYFISMNIIVFFSANEFNNTLHLLIDIRTYQIIFTAGLRLKSKFDLMISPQFILILFLMLVAYVFFSLGVDWANFVGFGIYSVIGLIMFTVPIK